VAAPAGSRRSAPRGAGGHCHGSPVASLANPVIQHVTQIAQGRANLGRGALFIIALGGHPCPPRAQFLLAGLVFDARWWILVKRSTGVGRPQDRACPLRSRTHPSLPSPPGHTGGWAAHKVCGELMGPAPESARLPYPRPSLLSCFYLLPAVGPSRAGRIAFPPHPLSGRNIVRRGGDWRRGSVGARDGGGGHGG